MHFPAKIALYAAACALLACEPLYPVAADADDTSADSAADSAPEPAFGLVDLTASDGLFVPAFAPSTTVYTLYVGLATAAVSFVATALPGATMKLNGDKLDSGAASSPVSAGYTGDSALLAVSTGKHSVPYTIHIQRGIHQQDGYLKSSASVPSLGFGGRIAMDADNLFIAATGESNCSLADIGNACANSGAVYLFTRKGSTWTRTGTLKASLPAKGDRFGSNLALSGSTLAVAAMNQAGCSDDPGDIGCEKAGAAYIFSRKNGSWSEEKFLKSSSAQAFDAFGSTLSLSGDTLAVTSLGGIHIFTRKDGVWSEESFLKLSGVGVLDGLGTAISLAGDSLLIGVPSDKACDSKPSSFTCDYAGAAYVYTRKDGVWSQEAWLKASNSEKGDEFGSAVSILGNVAVIGAPGESSCGASDPYDNLCANAGSAYVFFRGPGGWSEWSYLKASQPGIGDQFGSTLGIDDNGVVIGAPTESRCNSNVSGQICTSSGAAYVFVPGTTNWLLNAYVKASNADSYDLFGLSVGIGGGRIAIGSGDASCGGNPGDNGCAGAGAVYVFE